MSDRLVVLDASAVLTFVLKAPRTSLIERLLPVGVVPAPNMTEVLHVAPQRGYRNSPENLYLALLDTGVVVEPFGEDDVVRAAALLTASRANPGTHNRSLSLGDAQCLAVAERLDLPVTGGDTHWSTLDLKVDFHLL